MPRDIEPPVRERDAAPTRRGSRREQESADRREPPDDFAPPTSRVARDEHRPRRGTLPDRRMLRRDPPIDYSAEFTDPDPAADATRAPAPEEFAAQPNQEPLAPAFPPEPDPVIAAPRADVIATPRVESIAEPPVESVVEPVVSPVSSETGSPAVAAEPDGGVAVSVDEVVSTPVKRRRPALPALEPPTVATESGASETGREIAIRAEAGPGDALRAGAAVLEGEHTVERPAKKRVRSAEPTEGDRMERRRSRDTVGENGEAGRRPQRERRGDLDQESRRPAPGGAESADRGPEFEGRGREADGRVRGPERRGRDADGRRREAEGRGHGTDGRGRDADPRGRDADGRSRESERRGRESEGRGRPTDADRVHLGGRAGSPGRARPRPEGEPGERPVRERPMRKGKPDRTPTEPPRSRKGKRDKVTEQADREAAAKRVAARRAAAKKKPSGPKLLDDSTRAKLEVTARENNGIKAALATFRLHTDDLRRRNFAARAERIEYGSFDEFDRTTAQLTDRGYIGAGGGRMNVVGRPVEYRATTAQVAGLWPWSVGAGAPLIGTPLGSHLHTGAPVCFDPMNWFMRGSFITAPSLFVLGLNGFGKSSLVRRIVLGGVAQGITPLILADVKPDYRKLVEMVGGQVIDLGYGHGKLNPLAAGVLGSIVPLLDDLPELQTQVMQEMRARQVTLLAGLVELVRGARVRDFEETLIATALRVLYREGSGFTPDQPPIIEDLLEIVVTGGDELQLDAGADNPDEYHEAIKGLRRSLRALTQGPFGAVFNGQTTTPIDTDATAVCIDVSHIPTGDKKLKAAVMLACWADGFASVEAAHVLADADMGPQRYFQVVMDELWQVLGLGDFMVDRVDELTRLQRGIATSLIMISHTIKDLQALGSEAAIAKALGFLERARAKIFGALPAEEISRLDSTVPFTSAEEEMVTSWSAPQALTGEALKPGQQRPPAPGTGKFLLKIGEDRRPGIPFHMEFTLSEKESGIHDTNQRFSEFTESTARRGADEGSVA
ncbi:hypothetical protein ACFXHA_27905 [Nocardia sp. NPDC059240]|uniref:hypothetical protein n=1 Tax=Nocardia sp. NPDC059240 TaxID=3346786 RepID=UPI00369DCB32